MITKDKVGNRTVYWTDNQKEREDLVSRGHVVYFQEETNLFAAHPDIFTDDFRTLLFQLKSLAPSVRLVGVKST